MPPMSTERAKRLMELFEQACRLDASARPGFLDEHCGGDAELRRDLERMFAHDAATQPLFRSQALVGEIAQAAGALAGGVAAAPVASEMPSEIGPYRILGCIGQGGMGTVYEAEQQSPRRTVALKVIRPELVSLSLAQRFEIEAHVLGRLQHPGIAQVFEAGTIQTPTGPQMFIAMELVRGKPLTEHARAEPQPLSVRQRVALMARVCDAVHHAHQRGIIHRDLKPSNILVVPETDDHDSSGFPTGAAPAGVRSGTVRAADSVLRAGDRSLAHVGQPKVLDFGVARASDSDLQVTLVQTGFGQLIGTLPYMSPEQFAGDPAEIDTRSDVYALGVILYELLTGALPHPTATRSIPEAIRAVREDVPRPLSSFSRVLRGELDTIVAKALDKDKARRYQSAAELGSDLRRFLAGEPILAKRDSNLYVLRKTLRRYRLAAAAGTAVLVLALAASLALVVLYSRAEKSRKAAEHERSVASAAHAAAQREAERARAEERKTHQINQVLTRLFHAADPKSAKGRDRTVREVLDECADRVLAGLSDAPDVRAAVQYAIGQTYQALGEYERAERLHRDAYNTAKALYGDEPRRDTADYAVSLAAVVGNLGQLDEAETLLREALAMHVAVEGADSPDVAWDLHSLSTVLVNKHELDEAEVLARRSLAMYRRYREQGLTDLGGPAPDEQSMLTDALGSLVMLLYQQRDFEEALPLAREALEVARSEVGEAHPQMAMALNNLGAVLSAIGRKEEALERYEQAIAVVRQVQGADHPDVASGLVNVGLELLDQSQPERAEAAFREAVEIRRAKLPAGHVHIGDALSGWGMALTRAGRAQEAEPVLREALELRRGGYPPGDARVAFTQVGLGSCLVALGRYEEAEPLLRDAHAVIAAQRGPRHKYALEALRGLLRIYEEQERTDEAAEVRAALDVPRS